MSQRLSQRLDNLLQRQPDALRDIHRGVEKEGLRADSEGRISQTDHPQALGSTLTHPSITTDYSEALLELITPVENSIDNMLTDLRDTHKFVQANLPDGEVFWAGSMPCRLEGDPSIRIAEYGSSNVGTIKHVYRKGLSYRYGRIMQSIAGVHFNFSMGDTFWEALHQLEDGDQSLQDFKSDTYFSLIRNFRRWSWLLMYLFGASPVLDKSFLNGRQHQLEEMGPDTLGLPYATSLRMSGLGYQNNAQSSLKICFNHLNTYLSTLFEATHVPYPDYEKIGIRVDGEYRQLNTNLLQIENEYYNSIRPKRVAASGEKPIQALQRRGVEYIEVRCLDLNPFSPIGIETEKAHFLDVFLLTCLLDESPMITDEECGLIEQNFAATVERGRDPQCYLTRIENKDSRSDYRQVLLRDWGYELLEKMEKVAELMVESHGDERYKEALKHAHATLTDSHLTPSAKLLTAMGRGRKGYADWILDMSQRHHQQLLDEALTPEQMQQAQRLSEQSWLDERALREADSQSFEDYLRQYLTYS
ncbi:glutamate--cysteine ligase [Hahella sp. CCB-MM4]|uniref:glutamate--cysteine ligase n=1 Tax=Hahella sp. (strain CCB-MM4) TaxID=1926491 RepID=UPI000B9A1FAC|nr:glutamate--cysteine ligase [Hahella sp. CCB-MM4]OZG74297.1 glutamate--cysteine ligase [Hahella sp. CCB-MM4]